MPRAKQASKMSCLTGLELPHFYVPATAVNIWRWVYDLYRLLDDHWMACSAVYAGKASYSSINVNPSWPFIHWIAVLQDGQIACCNFYSESYSIRLAGHGKRNLFGSELDIQLRISDSQSGYRTSHYVRSLSLMIQKRRMTLPLYCNGCFMLSMSNPRSR